MVAQNTDRCQEAINGRPCHVERLVNAVSHECKDHKTVNPRDLTKKEADGDFEQEMKEVEMGRLEAKWLRKYGPQREQQAARLEAEGNSYEYGLFIEAHPEVSAQALGLDYSDTEVEESATVVEETAEEPVEELPPPKIKASGSTKTSWKSNMRGWAYIPENEIKPTQEEIWNDILKKSS